MNVERNSQSVKKWILPAIALLIAVIVAPFVVRIFTAPEDRGPAVEDKVPPQPPSLKIEAVRYGPIEKKITLTGQVNPTEHGRVDITTPLQGIVIQPLVKVGDRVQEGQPLAEINSVYGTTVMQLTQKLDSDRGAVLSAQATLQQAVSALGQARSTLAQAQTTLSQSIDNLTESKAELVNAHHDFSRKNRLFKDGVFAYSDVEDAKERYDKAVSATQDAADVVRFSRHGVYIARKNIAPAEENVRVDRNGVVVAQKQVEHDLVIFQGALHPTGSAQTQFYIRSPISGTVYAFSMSAGLAVSPGTILASVVDTKSVYVDANAYESDLRGLQSGDPIAVVADGFPGETFTGHVSAIGKVVDPTTRTVAVRSMIENPHDELRPGLWVQATLSPGHPQQALLVPERAVLITGKEHYVVVVGNDGKYARRKVEEGVTVGGVAELLSGVKAGERIVTEGNLLVTTADTE